jgi:hypothetical protein
MEAVRYLKGLAEVGPIVVITKNEWGTPADALWVYLSGMPKITMYYTDHAEVLRPGDEGGAGAYLLRRDKWLFPAYEAVRLEPGTPVLYVTSAQKVGGEEAEDFLRQKNPNLGAVETFNGLKGPDGKGDPDGRVLVFNVRLPTSLSEKNRPKGGEAVDGIEGQH